MALTLSERIESPPRLDALDFDVAVVDDTVEARLTVANTTRLRLEGQVWWTLHEVGTENPWLNRLYRSEPRDLDLQRDTRGIATWEELPEVAPGTYGIRAWTHVKAGTRSEHSDSLDVGPIELTRPVDLVRVHVAPGRHSVRSVGVSQEPDRRKLGIEVELQGGAADQWVVAETIPWPAPDVWWRAPALDGRSVEVGRGHASVNLPVPAEAFAIRVALHDSSGRLDLVLVDPASASIGSRDAVEPRARSGQ